MTIADCLRKYKIPCRGIIHVGAGMLEEAPTYSELGFSRVVWIEANPEDLETRRAIALKHGHTLHIAALDSECRDRQLRVTSSPSCSSLLFLGTHLLDHPDITETHCIAVTTTTGKKLLEERPGWQACNVLSVDAQGLEYEVLLGFKECVQQFDAIYSESFLKDVYIGCGKFRDIDNLLWAVGFLRMETWICPGEGWGEGFWVRWSFL